MRAKDILSKLVIPLKPSDTGSLALNWMEELGVTHLPVVQGEKLLGMVKSADIYGMDDPDGPIGTDKLPLNRSCVYADQHFFEVLRMAANENLSVVPVLDTNENYLGTITHWETILSMASYTSVKQPGGILVLEVSSQEYALSEIARIVEANDAKILSVSVSSPPESTRLEVTIKVSVMDLSSIIQTFNRYDYIIKASFANENQYDTLLSERYESLMKYLDI